MDRSKAEPGRDNPGGKGVARRASDPELFEAICQALEEGEPLRQVLRRPGAPSYREWLGWTEESPEAEERYRKALERQVQVWVDQVMDDARRPLSEVQLPPRLRASRDEGARERYVRAAMSLELQRRKHLAATVQWLAQRVAAELYGAPTAAARGSVRTSDGDVVEVEVFATGADPQG